MDTWDLYYLGGVDHLLRLNRICFHGITRHRLFPFTCINRVSDEVGCGTICTHGIRKRTVRESPPLPKGLTMLAPDLQIHLEAHNTESTTAVSLIFFRPVASTVL